MDDRMVRAICEVRQNSGRAALATIIATKGSTPRKAGSKMLIYSDGRVAGTIGGGCAEADVRLQGLQALDDGQSRLYRVDLLDDTATDEGMACGGVMEVFIQIV